MLEFLIRLAVLFGLAFGVAYGLTRAAKSARQKRILKELAEAKEKLAGLRKALADGDLSQREHDDLSVRIYERCKDRGVPLDEVEVEVESTGPAEHEKGRST
jgi:F0F1-type ATP synthase membrane subunit b/b'